MTQGQGSVLVSGSAVPAKKEDDPRYDCCIIGGGPAGLSAALQLARLNRRILLVDGGRGRSTGTQVVRNYPGVQPIPAWELRQLINKQLESYEDRISRTEALATADDLGESRAIPTVILATGVQDRFPYFKDWRGSLGNGIYHCAHCDGLEMRGKRVLYLGNFGTMEKVVEGTKQLLEIGASSVSIWNIQMRVDAEYVRALQGKHAIVLQDCLMDAILRTRHGWQIRFLPKGTGRGFYQCFDAIWFADEPTPNSDLARSLGVECEEKGYIKVDREQKTNVAGIFAAGDVTKPYAHFVATAAHEGLTAATSVDYYLRTMRQGDR